MVVWSTLTGVQYLNPVRNSVSLTWRVKKKSNLCNVMTIIINLILHRTSLWGPEWTCASTKLSFCALEGMCNYPDACPLSAAGEFGGNSWPPNSMMTLVDDITAEAVNATWDYQ